MSISPSRPRRRCALLVFVFFSVFGLATLDRVAQAQNASEPAQIPVVEVATAHSVLSAVVLDAPAADLPDAPEPAAGVVMETAATPAGESTSVADDLDFLKPGAESIGYGVSQGPAGRVPLDQCPDDTTHARECRPHWHQLIITASVFNAFQNTGNLYTGYWYRYETTTGKWFRRWFDSDLGWRWGQWHDGNPFLDDYVGHPMMGGITDYMWIQNDPRAMTVEFGNTREYWHSRLAALLFSTAYSFEWKFGPFGEAGVGHNGDHTTDVVNGAKQNDTGDVELVTTPVGGLGWNIAEDILDKYVVRKWEETPHNPFTLLAISFLTPARATANIFRFRPPWYRDGRQVKSSSFFSQPPGPTDEVAASQPDSNTGKPVTLTPGETGPETGLVQTARTAQVLPLWPRYGGVHEFGAWWGLSLISGHIWGYAKDIKYMPIDVSYSYLLYPGAKWNFRYAPELTALAMMDEPVPGQTNPQLMRKRTYGGGLSPVGFRASFYPQSRVQPFLSTDGGFIYFDDRVLSPQGSQFMYTIDYGCGLTIFRKQRQSVTIGYRYQHLSNADISLHNPGTDANTFDVAVSRFRTRGYR